MKRKALIIVFLSYSMIFIFAKIKKVITVKVYIDKAECDLCNEMKIEIIRKIIKQYGKDRIQYEAVVRKNNSLERLDKWFEQFKLDIDVIYCREEDWNKIMFRTGGVDIIVTSNDNSKNSKMWRKVSKNPGDAYKGIKSWINSRLSM